MAWYVIITPYTVKAIHWILDVLRDFGGWG